MEKKLPKNWIESHLYDLTEPVKTGVKLYEGEKKYYSTGSIKENGLSVEGIYTFDKKPSRANREVKVNDVLQARMSDTLKALIINEVIKESLFSTGFMQLRVYNGTIIPKYIFYYLKSDIFNLQKNELASGTTQVAINDVNAKKITLPLAPLSEQKRIVDKLDNLFEQLETIKASMANIPLLLKDFRQQVLTQAVTGKLTSEWRKGKKVVEWKKEKLSNIADIIDPHPSHRTPPEVENGIPYISIGDIDKTSKIDFFNSRKVSPTILDEHLKRYQLKDGDFIFGKIGTIGKPIIIPSVQDYTLSANVILIQPKKEIVHPKFIFFYMDSTVLMKLIMADTKSTSQPAYGIKKMREQIIPFPIIEEQQEIVSRVESLFAKADAIEQQYKSLKEKIYNLPQALLHKAFKGELTDQLDTDGDAKDLLKEIQNLKTASKKIVNSKLIPKKTKVYSENKEVLAMVAEPK